MVRQVSAQVKEKREDRRYAIQYLQSLQEMGA